MHTLYIKDNLYKLIADHIFKKQRNGSGKIMRQDRRNCKKEFYLAIRRILAVI